MFWKKFLTLSFPPTSWKKVCNINTGLWRIWFAIGIVECLLGICSNLKYSAESGMKVWKIKYFWSLNKRNGWSLIMTWILNIDLELKKNSSKIFVNVWIKISPRVLRRIGEKKGHVTVGTAEKCVKRKSKITYDGYKQYETEEFGGEYSQSEHGSSSQPLTVYSPKKRQLAFSKLSYIRIRNYETSKLSIYKT